MIFKLIICYRGIQGMQDTLYGDLMCALALVPCDFLTDFPKFPNFLCKNGRKLNLPTAFGPQCSPYTHRTWCRYISHQVHKVAVVV